MSRQDGLVRMWMYRNLLRPPRYMYLIKTLGVIRCQHFQMTLYFRRHLVEARRLDRIAPIVGHQPMNGQLMGQLVAEVILHGSFKWYGELELSMITQMNAYCCFQFGPILAYLESETQISGQSKHEMMDVPLLRLIYERWKRRKLEPRDTIFPVKLSDELPSNTIIHCLVGRYFETYHTIFPLLDETDFKHSLDSLLEKSS